MWPSFGAGVEPAGWVAPGENPTVEDHGRTYALIPHVNWDSVDLGADGLVRRAALALTDEATEKRTPQPSESHRVLFLTLTLTACSARSCWRVCDERGNGCASSCP